MKSKHPSCNSEMSFQECELTILREAVDKAEEIQSKKTLNSPEIQKMIKIVENFLRRKKLVCYGGTAINALLPSDDKFYNKETDLADYDFFSKNPVEDAKELANIFYKEGFDEVEAKSGQHHGTYKVFVNFIGMADITYLHKDIYTALSKESKKVGGILYCPPNYLRMSMYLELSRPAGDVGRWEKVLKRLSLLNKHYPLTDSDCGKTAIQRKLSKTSIYKNKTEHIYNIVKNTLVSEGVVFFGGYAISNFLCYMPKHLRNKNRNVNAPDFDVLSEEAELTSIILKERLQENGIKNVTIKKQIAVGEVISAHYQVIVGKKDTVAFIYETMACHSFNKIHVGDQVVRVATIDTILSLYLAFLYSGRKYYDLNRLVCIAKLLYDVQERNRLQQKGVLKRFSISCYGHQETVEEMRTGKSEMFEKLKSDRNSKDFEEWFLRYKPAEKSTPNKNTKKTAKKTVKKTSKTTKKSSVRRTGGKKGTRKKKLKQ